MSEIGIGSTVWGLEEYSGRQPVELIVDGETVRSWEFTRHHVTGKFPKKPDAKGERWTGVLKNWREEKFQIFTSYTDVEGQLATRAQDDADRRWRGNNQYAIGQRVGNDHKIPMVLLRQIAALVGYEPKESA